MTKGWHQQVIVTPGFWLDGGVPSELRGMTKPDSNHIRNGSGTIESLVVSLELQIDDWLRSLHPKNIQTWENGKGQWRWWCIRSGQWWIQSRVYLVIGVLRWKDFHSNLIEISLPIFLYLHFTWSEFLSTFIPREKLFAYLLEICTFVHVTSN